MLLPEFPFALSILQSGPVLHEWLSANHDRESPVNRIDHYLTGSYLLDCFQPGEHKLIGCIIHIFPKVATFQKHSLNNTISFEFFHLFDDLPYGIFPVGTIQEMNVFFVHRIQFEDIIIYLVNASNTAGRSMKVELLNTLTFAFGK